MPNIIYNNRKEDFADWVRNELQQRDWSQAELARRAEITSSAVSALLTGKNEPGLDLCVGIAQAFDLPPEYVLRKAGLIPPLPEEDMDLLTKKTVNILRKLNDKHKEEVRDFAEYKLQKHPQKAHH